MKLHLAVDESDNQILSVVLTDNSYKDNEVFEEVMMDIESEVAQATGDGAYDSKNCWSWTEDHGGREVSPPRKGAKLKVHGNTNQQPLQRDEHNFTGSLRSSGDGEALGRNICIAFFSIFVVGI